MENPYTVKQFSEKDKEKVKKVYSEDMKYVHIGPKGYVHFHELLKYSADIYNMQLRPTDVFVASFPRSGTTWTQELVWQLVNDLDFERAKASPLTARFPFLEMYMNYDRIRRVFPGQELKLDPPVPEVLPEMAEPRLIKTHLPMSFLPENILDTVKMLYIARDPRDVVVSLYHFFKSLKFMGVICNFKEFFDLFLDDLNLYSPFWDHIEEAWALRDHPNMLFLFYEDLSKDLKSCARRVAKFLNKQYSEEQLDTLCEHLRFDNFQNNRSVNMHDKLLIDDGTFVRKGQSGGWRSALDGETRARVCAWVRDNMRARGLRLPWSEE